MMGPPVQDSGRVWVVSKGGAALNSFAIPRHSVPVGLGPIHLLSVHGLRGTWLATRAIYRREVPQHAAIKENLFVRGVAVVGAFNVLLGRTVQRVLTPDLAEAGDVLIVAVRVWAFWPLVRCSGAPNAAPQRSVQRGVGNS